jgi:hypothetical protein
MLIALLHARTLVACVVCVIVPGSLSFHSNGTLTKFRQMLSKGVQSNVRTVTAEQVMSICRLTAVVLLLLAMCHSIFFCYLHSAAALEANSLHRMIHTHGGRAEMDSFARGTNRRITFSVAEQLQVQRVVWVSLKTTPNAGCPSTARDPDLGDAAVNTVVLLASSGITLCSCFYLIESLSPPDSMQWVSSLCALYIIVPVFLGLAGMGATYLHSHRYHTAVAGGEIVSGAIASTSRLLYAILPASAVVEWAINSGHSIMCFDMFQAVVLGMAVVLSMCFFQTGSDDW